MQHIRRQRLALDSVFPAPLWDLMLLAEAGAMHRFTNTLLGSVISARDTSSFIRRLQGKVFQDFVFVLFFGRQRLHLLADTKFFGRC